MSAEEEPTITIRAANAKEQAKQREDPQARWRPKTPLQPLPPAAFPGTQTSVGRIDVTGVFARGRVVTAHLSFSDHGLQLVATFAPIQPEGIRLQMRGLYAKPAEANLSGLIPFEDRQRIADVVSVLWDVVKPPQTSDDEAAS